MPMIKIACLFSGGKDSTFALYWALLQGWDVKCLISLISKNKESYMFHVPNIDKVDYQAKAMAIPILTEPTGGEKEKELKDLKKALKKAKSRYKITGVVAGAIASEYQRIRINFICHELNLKVYAPLWHKKPINYLNELVNAGFDVRIVSVSAEGIPPDFLGKKINRKMVQKLEELSKKHGFHPAFEGGEAETFVVNGPIFRKRIIIKKSRVVKESENTAYLELMKLSLEKK